MHGSLFPGSSWQKLDFVKIWREEALWYESQRRCKFPTLVQFHGAKFSVSRQLDWNPSPFWPGFHCTFVQKMPISLNLFVLLVMAMPGVKAGSNALGLTELSRPPSTGPATHAWRQLAWDPPTLTLQSTSETFLDAIYPSGPLVFISYPRVITCGLLFTPLFICRMQKAFKSKVWCVFSSRKTKKESSNRCLELGTGYRKSSPSLVVRGMKIGSLGTSWTRCCSRRACVRDIVEPTSHEFVCFLSEPIYLYFGVSEHPVARG